MVSQRVDILNGSLRDNLQMAKPCASDEEAISVLNKVSLQPLMEQQGLDVWLGDGEDNCLEVNEDEWYCSRIIAYSQLLYGWFH